MNNNSRDQYRQRTDDEFIQHMREMNLKWAKTPVNFPRQTYSTRRDEVVTEVIVIELQEKALEFACNDVDLAMDFLGKAIDRLSSSATTAGGEARQNAVAGADVRQNAAADQEQGDVSKDTQK